MNLEMESYDKKPYSVPDGYFRQLEERLMHIPEENAIDAGLKGAAWQSCRKYLAAAAVIAAVVVTGLTMSRNIDSEAEPLSGESLWMSDLVPVTDPYMFYGEGYHDDAEVGSDILTGDLTAYLIDTGTTLEAIEYYENLK